MVQNQRMRMICGLKARRGVTEAKEKLELQPLDVRRRNSLVKLLLKILSKEDVHPVLIESYNDIINQNQTSAQTRAQTHEKPQSITTNTNSFHNSFLPRTIRDLKIGSE